jgi:hypothetical protein
VSVAGDDSRTSTFFEDQSIVNLRRSQLLSSLFHELLDRFLLSRIFDHAEQHDGSTQPPC